jgi:predicted neuraminidase
MKAIFAFLILLLPDLLIASNPFTGDVCIKAAEFIYQTGDVDFPGCHASTIVETKSGFLAAWFGGTEERNPDVCIYVSSCINGKWNKPVKAADGVQNGKQYPCWNPVLFRKDNGEIVLFYKVGPNPREWWGLFKTSADNGETWYSANLIPDGLLGPIKDKPVRLANGTILCPSSIETSASWNIHLETTGQDLKSWKKIEINNNGLNSIQPTILFYPEGKMQLLCRSRNRQINNAWSADGGMTWSALGPTNLPNNNSGIDAVTLSDGTQLLVFNPVTSGRNVLGVAVSKDGKNWEAAALLENDPDSEAEYSYPAVIQAKDGLVHITYTWNRKLIKHVVLDPGKIAGKPIPDGNWPKE